MAKISAFSVGHCTHPSCMALKGSGFKSRCFPSRAFLIETKAGLCLWDTGYASRFMDEVSSGAARLYGWVTPVFFDESASLVRQLEAVGVAPRDIGRVVLSHFHADHMAGLKDFPNASVYCCANGWHKHKHLRGFAAVRKAFLPGLVPARMEDRLEYIQRSPMRPLPSELQPFSGGWDLTGTGEVFVVELPGHAIGHLGAFIKEDSGWTLLASDAAWAAEAYREMRGPSELSFVVQDSRKSYYETLQKIHQLNASGDVRIELTHEDPTYAPGKVLTC